MRSKNKKTIVIGILCCLLVFMGVGFAVLNQTLNIGGTTTATNTWAVLIESIAPIKNNTGAKSTSSEVLADKVSATFKAEFQKPGDYIEYEIVVANRGSIDATLKTVTSSITPEADASLFTFDYSEAPQGETLAAGETTSFKIKITYNLSATTTPTGDVVFNLDLDYVQGTGSEGGGDIPNPDDPSDWLFDVDENGEVVAYNYNSTLTETPQNVVVPATVGGVPVTTITEQSFIPKGNFSAYMDQTNMKIYALINEDDTVIVDTVNNRTAVQVVGYKALMALTYEECQGDASCLANYTGITYLCTDKNSCYAYTDETKTITASVPESGLSVLAENMYINPDPNVALEESIVTELKANVETLDLSNATNLTTIEANALEGAGLTSIEFGDNSSITTIGDSAFANNELTSVEIPASVESIGNNAFSQNSDATTKLESVTFETEPVAQNQLNKNNKYSLSRMNSTVTKLTSQKSALKSIGYNAFQNNEIKTLTLPEGIETIGNSAFQNNSINGELIIPSTLTSIGYSAFQNNKITNLTIPKTVTTLLSRAFASNPIEVLSIGKCTTSICSGDSTFGSSNFGNSIKTLTIESGEIGSYAFGNTETSENKITSLTLGNGVTSIGISAFQNNEIKTVTLPEGIKTIDNNAFENNLISGELIIPSTLTSIGISAFQNNKITNLAIPKTVEKLSSGAFASNPIEVLSIGKCTTSICSGNSTSGSSNFGNSIKTLTIESGEIGGYAFYNAETSENKITSLTLGEGVTIVRYNAFQNNAITELIIPKTLTTIGASAFIGNPIEVLSVGYCTTSICSGDTSGSSNFGNSIKTLTIESGAIGRYAFYSNFDSLTKITSLTLGSGVTSIGDYAFQNNQITGDLTIPESVTSIGISAFENNLINGKLDILGSGTISANAFNNNQLSEAIISGNILTISNNAFSNNQIIKLTIPKTVTTMYTDSFTSNLIETLSVGKCTSDICTSDVFGKLIKNLTIESGVVSEGTNSTSGAFRYHSDDASAVKIEKLVLGDGVTSIGGYAFQNNAITELTIPASVTNLGTTVSNSYGTTFLNYVFSGNPINTLTIEKCTTNVCNPGTNGGYWNMNFGNDLTNLTIESGIIPENAFWNSGVVNLTLGSGVTSIGENAFGSNPTLSTIFINRTQSDFLANVSVGKKWYDTTLNPTITYKQAQ